MAKIALGTGREAFQADCIRALIVEFICTFLFVFAGVGAAMGSGITFFFFLLQMPLTAFFGGRVRCTDKGSIKSFLKNVRVFSSNKLDFKMFFF